MTKTITMDQHELARIRAILTGRQERAYWQMYSKAAQALLAELDARASAEPSRDWSDDETRDCPRCYPPVNRTGDV